MTRKTLLAALLAPPLLAPAGELAKPVKLEAGGKPIDTQTHLTYAGPLVGDITGDGLPDLTVTTIQGVFLVYKNTGKNESGDPLYEQAEDLPKEKVPPTFQNW